MRLIPNEKVPAPIYRYLLPHERKVICVRMHPSYLAPSLAMSVGGLLAAVAVGPVASVNSGLTLAMWVLEGALIAQSCTAITSWLNRYLVVTSHRIMLSEHGSLRSGLRVSLPLSQVQDIRLVRSPGGRIQGYGTLVCDSAGISFDYISYPQQLYLEITGLLFRESSDGS